MSIKAPIEDLTDKINNLIKTNKDLEKKINSSTTLYSDDLFEKIIANGIEKNKSKIMIYDFKEVDNKYLNNVADKLLNKIESGIILLISTNVETDKFSLLLVLTNNLVSKKLEAKNIINDIAKFVSGTGGGRKDRAQAGGKNTELLSELKNHANKILLDLV